MKLRFGNDPSGWVTKHGHPARAAGQGMPSFESGNRKLTLFTPLAVLQLPRGRVMFLPLGYSDLSEENPAGYVSPNPRVRSSIPWRPCLYEMAQGGIEGKGSQQELDTRHEVGTSEEAITLLTARFGDRVGERLANSVLWAIRRDMDESDKKARAILLEHLSPQQRLEFRASRTFRARGGHTGNLYWVQPDNGFALLNPRTLDIVTSYCLHTEHWIPRDDVALATKFALEDSKLEQDCLANAGQGEVVGRLKRPTEQEAMLCEMEKELIT